MRCSGVEHLVDACEHGSQVSAEGVSGPGGVQLRIVRPKCVRGATVLELWNSHLSNAKTQRLGFHAPAITP
jgi:hypothetical protein